MKENGLPLLAGEPKPAKAPNFEVGVEGACIRLTISLYRKTRPYRNYIGCGDAI